MKTWLAVGFAVSALVASASGVYAVVRLATGERAAPARCGGGLVPIAGRCCAPGQTATGGRCMGEPSSCPDGMHLAEAQSGCVVDYRRIAYRGGILSLGAEDWQSEGVAIPRTTRVAAFQLDAVEVTVERWSHCAVAGVCPAAEESEPGVPVTRVDAKTAEKFCRFDGGRLPTSEEWLFAAAGGEARRFPWGPTGLVCRRAAFGIEHGPCASGGRPELVGSRPDGATVDGALDLSGNVAEWTLERDGRAVARGGSYRSQSAGELTTWSSELVRGASPYVGFRCARDLTPAPGSPAPAPFPGAP